MWWRTPWWCGTWHVRFSGCHKTLQILIAPPACKTHEWRLRATTLFTDPDNALRSAHCTHCGTEPSVYLDPFHARRQICLQFCPEAEAPVRREWTRACFQTPNKLQPHILEDVGWDEFYPRTEGSFPELSWCWCIHCTPLCFDSLVCENPFTEVIIT